MPNIDEDEMLDEYDFSAGVRGKYVDRMKSGSNLIVIDPDVARTFPDHDSVNNALRHLVAVIADQR
jgi:hypothetical protein